MTTSILVPLPVLLPLLGAGISLVITHKPRLQRWLSLVVLIANAAIAAVLLIEADRSGPQVMWMGEWPETIGIVLVADRLAALMVLVSSLVTLAVLGYSIGQGMVEDEESAPLSVYHPTFLVLVAGVANAFLAGDLFNLFVSFEMLLFASYVLLTLGGTGPRIRAGTIYVLVALLSSSLFLISLAATYAATGTLTLAHLAERIADLPPHVSLMLQLLLLTTFAIKAAIFPLSFWLPDSYPTAPAPVTAVFAGLLTKVGIYAILRMQMLLFPHSPLTDLLLWVALFTMLVGILGAIAQSDIKRMLSFTLVSHIGYLVLGDRRRRGGRGVGDDVLRRPPHHRADGAVPGRRPGRTQGGQHVAGPDRRTGADRAAAGRAVLRARDEPGGDPAVLRLHRQGRAAPGGPGAGHRPGLDPGGGQRADQPAHPVRRGEDLGGRLLAHPAGGARGAGRDRGGRGRPAARPRHPAPGGAPRPRAHLQRHGLRADDLGVAPGRRRRRAGPGLLPADPVRAGHPHHARQHGRSRRLRWSPSPCC